ncbi:hypothetical protein MTX78_18005 [Hymenobacter tibetensis]|uniref:Uncharacterized protein n=1 Tax=Hymenobacter tibetensis TaxID=497967 RepID=A0ABY4CUR2_9BACT|nr:hypothetical protein [Hymenobacter tibetensis]UOG74005.1 hypothetical protein MTX78_18005 [Hymenobacter tibetensis]
MLSFISLISVATLLPVSTSPDSLTIFNPNRTYHYRALFISPTGDTLSQERITLRPSGQPWAGQPKRQTAFQIEYHYTPHDSLTFLALPNPKTTRSDKPLPYWWSRSQHTGAIENRHEIWMHPIRGNQYEYTEVAPFPQVKPDSLRVGGRWREKPLYILMGWGAFKGKVTPNYQAEKQETRQYGALHLPGCWLIHAVGLHNKLGESFLDFYFHPSYGFTEMHYRLYDGTRISFVLEQVVDSRLR